MNKVIKATSIGLLFLMQSLSFPVTAQIIKSQGNNILTTQPPILTGEVGCIEGHINVSSSGAATYNIPIEVPPGTAGMVPSLSINYSSQSLNGLMGIGWSLGGFSSITRTRQDFFMIRM